MSKQPSVRLISLNRRAERSRGEISVVETNVRKRFGKGRENSRGVETSGARFEKLSSLEWKGKKTGPVQWGEWRGWERRGNSLPYPITTTDRDVGFLARSSYRKLSLIKCLISTFPSLPTPSSNPSLSLSSFGWQSGVVLGAESYPLRDLHERAPIHPINVTLCRCLFARE